MGSVVYSIYNTALIGACSSALMRHMIYSKVYYLQFLMSTSPSILKIFLIVGKANLGLLLEYKLLFARNDA